MNPFRTWAELARGLRYRFVTELGDARPSPYATQVLAMLAALGTHCGHLGQAFAELGQKDPAALEAFLRALEKS